MVLDDELSLLLAQVKDLRRERDSTESHYMAALRSIPMEHWSSGSHPSRREASRRSDELRVGHQRYDKAVELAVERFEWLLKQTIPDPSQQLLSAAQELLSDENARLIDAAQELLEALRGVLKAAERGRFWLGDPSHAAARAAIAKAEGSHAG